MLTDSIMGHLSSCLCEMQVTKGMWIGNVFIESITTVLKKWLPLIIMKQFLCFKQSEIKKFFVVYLVHFILS